MRPASHTGGTRCGLALATLACAAAIGLGPVLAPHVEPLWAAFRKGLSASPLLSVLLGFLLALFLSMSVGTLRAGRRAPRGEAPEAAAAGPAPPCLVGAGGGTSLALFDSTQCASCAAPCGIAGEMEGGLERGEFVPYYQPIVALETGALIGFESLARWDHPTRGLVGPDAFISQAEDSGLIHELSLALLARACADMRDWPGHLTLSINLSPLQLAQAWMAPRILKTLWANGIAPGRLIVELTESRCISDFQRARRVLDSLKNAGVKVALDDFGTGYSSLIRLRELSFDRIKIDRAFTGELARAENTEIVRALLHLGDGLGVPVVAEGVETPGAAERLAELGCAYAQGFLYSPPISAKAALDLIASLPAARNGRAGAAEAQLSAMKDDSEAAAYSPRRISGR